MERMRIILITLVLFVVVALAEEVNADKGTKPAENEDTAKATNPEREVTNPKLEYYSQPLLTYESPRFKKIVKHCNSHVAQTCINSELLHHEARINVPNTLASEPLHHEGRKNVPNKLALCMFNSMEKCLVEHEVKYNTQGPSHPTQILPMTFENNFPNLPNPVKSASPPINLSIRFKSNNEQRPPRFENNFPHLPDPINPSRKPPTFPTTSFKYNTQGPHHPTIETLRMAENNFVYLPEPINPSRKPPTFPTTSFKYNTQGPHHPTIETLKMAENNFVYLPEPINPSRKPPTFPTTSFKYNTQGPHLPTIETLKLAENNFVYLPAPLTPSRKPPPPFPLITFQYNSYPFETPQTIQYQSILIENVKFETALKTCTHVTAQTCYKGNNVAKSDLASCLVPSMNQCMYPDDTIPKGDPA